jgi:hypothetical protein
MSREDVAPDLLLERAFQLAFFIHGDREVALAIATEAMGKLAVTAASQDKRLYYRPGSGPKVGKTLRFRSKVSWSGPHLLQRLVYIASEPFERRREESPGEDRARTADFVVHFVKHLVRITTKRNAFYVNLGIGRVLHRYSTEETMSMHERLASDAERMKDADYYRSRKVILMDELLSRFRGRLRTETVSYGEHRFQRQERSNEWKALVRDCLDHFTPWGTPCGEAFLADAGAPGSEHDREVARIHAILHPDCFRRLVEGLGLAAPDERLEVPQFMRTNDEDGRGGPGMGRHPAPPLSVSESEAIRGELEEQSARRRGTRAGLFRIFVDGDEIARFDATKSSRVCVGLSTDAELIELKTSGDLTLAAYLVTGGESGPQLSRCAVTLEGKQKISFSVVGEKLDLVYRETSPLRAAALVARRLIGRLSTPGRKRAWMPLGALAAGLLIVGIGLLFRIQKGRADSQNLVTRSSTWLRDVRTVRVEAAAADPASVDMRDLLARELRKRAPFQLADAGVPADAILKESMTDESGAAKLDLTLVAANGEVLWSSSGQRAKRLEANEDIARRAVDELLAELRQIKIGSGSSPATGAAQPTFIAPPPGKTMSEQTRRALERMRERQRSGR